MGFQAMNGIMGNMNCNVSDCTNKHLAKGYCSTHYKKFIYQVERPLYHTWQSIMARCYKKWSQAYKYYGGRGIKVCERWHSFENFEADVGVRPEGMTLDRINNDGDYEPSNIRWADRFIQRNNQRKPKLRTDNKYGYSGIRQLKSGRWNARVGRGGKYNLGTFNDKEEAITARDQWKGDG
jgi:hypothetical protein